MRKTLIALVGVLALGLGAVNAQTIDSTATSDYYAGASLGLIFAPNVTGSIAGQFGIRDVLAENLDARFDLGVLFSGGFNVGANALYNFDLEGDTPITIYVGGGPRLYIANPIAFGLSFRGGASYPFSDVVAGFAELRADPVFGSGAQTYFGLAVGADYSF